mmetsp:Transcript_33450/g.78889  ORF Transcript_33450/g.78889 Transcript_33450/m.78889 type:complete len:279 (+) Transcript_33450:1006-1842(+)
MPKGEALGVNAHADRPCSDGPLQLLTGDRVGAFAATVSATAAAANVLHLPQFEPPIRDRVPVHPVDAIPDDRVPNGRHVHVQLVGAAGDTRQQQPGHRQVRVQKAFPGNHLVLRFAGLGGLQQFLADNCVVQVQEDALVLVRGYPHKGWPHVVSHQRQIDRPLVVGDVSTHQGLVLPRDFSGAKERVHAPERFHRFGKDHDPGSVHAEPVDHHSIERTLVVGDGFKDRLGECRDALLAGNAQNPGWLVDAHNVFIFVDNLQFAGGDFSRPTIPRSQLA